MYKTFGADQIVRTQILPGVVRPLPLYAKRTHFQPPMCAKKETYPPIRILCVILWQLRMHASKQTLSLCTQCVHKCPTRILPYVRTI